MLRLPAGSRPLSALVLGAALLFTAVPVHAQYFGRNKVQYERFEFRVLKTEHFDVHYYPAERAAAEAAARMAERWYARLSRILRHELSGRQPLVLYATAPQFQQTNIVGQIGEGTGGVTEALRRRIVMPIGGTLGDLDHVLGHELVHAFQYDITGRGSPNTLGAIPAASALPLWFIEGMAEYLSVGPVSPFTAMWMRGGLEDTLPSFAQLDDPRFFPYRYGHALLAYVAGQWGDAIMGDLLRSAARARDIGRGIQAVLILSPEELVARWHAETYAAYGALRTTTQPAESLGTRIIAAGGRNEEGAYNVAPAISPDGDRLMFLSDRELFSIDLFLADARTGEVRRQITKTALDPHLQSLQFIQSAGSWDPSGRRFVFAGIASGRPLLRIYDVEREASEREIPFEELGEIFNPSWSPDGSSIVFSGVSGGLTDLYIYDLAGGELRRLTDDRYADLQPAWSPDGRSIVFASDRFTTDLSTLRIGRYTLALVDVESGRVRRVPGFTGARHLNPQWAPDGGSLYFLADPLGITNVYRLQLADGALSQVTDVFTGISGITETSPALSVAQRSGRVVFSLFGTDGYEIYGIDAPVAGAPPERALPGRPGVLPPPQRDGSTLLAALRNPVEGLPTDSAFPSQDYRSGLQLTYVGQPSLVAGSNRFGTYVGGGASLYWSDLLGNHNLVTGLQVNGGLKDVTAVIGYQDLGSRLNWGVVAQQVPYLIGAYGAGTETVDGEPVFVEQSLLERQTNRDLRGILAYPFSQVQRVELSAGVSRISFDRELRTIGTSLVTGREVIDETVDLESGEALTLGLGSAALVFDNSFFGATGPIAGQRYRLEVSPTFGSLDYVGVLADFRRYLLPVRPFTLAARVLHFGRYGEGGEDPRLQPLFLGYSGLVRGYTYGSFAASECVAPPDDPGACPVFDRLLGSRMLVANLELRFPLFGVLGLGSGYYGALPLDFTIFGDGGLAWESDVDPSFAGGDREPVFSAGAGFRFNLFGFAVAEVNLVRPFDRPGKGWLWEFNLQPGF
jgi:Tol biopolymer transport system component